MTRRVVFLDRDGVLTIPVEANGRGYAPRTLEDFALYADAAPSVALLKAAGFEVVVVTNQPDIGAGLVEPDLVEEMHRRLIAAVAVDRVRVCPHVAKDLCPCRKPAPGLLLAEAAGSDVDLAASWMVGDRDSDLAAGVAVGAHTAFINRGWRDETGAGADVVAHNLAEAVAAILSA